MFRSMKLKVALVCFVMVASSIANSLAANPPKAGAACTKVGISKNYQGKKYTCVKSGKKLVWNSGTILRVSPSHTPTVTISASPSPTPTVTISASPSPTPTVTPSPSPTPKPSTTYSNSESAICLGKSTNEMGKFKVALQLMDPFNRSQTLNGGGVFVKINSLWNHFAADITGKIEFLVPPGRYEIDTLFPLRSEYFVSRKGYVVDVNSSGQYSIPNSTMIENYCQISPEPSKPGIDRWSKVNSSDYKFSLEPFNLNSPKSTVKYIAPISNRRESSISLNLYPWESKHFVLLTLSNKHDPIVIGRLLRALDLSYEIYDDLTSRFPKYTVDTSSWSRMQNGKSIIAEIPDIDGVDSAKIISCGGNACTAVSTYGIEVRWQVLESTLWMLEHLDVYDHTLFYELGRTFWPQNTCAPKISLKKNDPTTTGFAVLMRYVVMKVIGISLGSDDAESGESYYSRLLEVENIFTSNKDLDLQSVFLDSKTVNGFDGNAIWASLMSYLGNNHGLLDFYKKFFSSCAILPNPTTDLMAIQNWKTLAEYAAGRDLSAIFNGRWRLSSAK